MNETDLHFFIDSTINYFEEVTGEKALTGIPYIKGKEPVILEYSGIIGISGKRKGCVYFTTTQAMLESLAHEILGITDAATETVKDLAGELANTISGNVREAYGSSFMISVPVVVEGKAKDIRLPENVQSFVIPITWKDFKSFLVVCLE
ncbi:MAG: chemotaxis protein CheX [Calditrichia bacterium]